MPTNIKEEVKRSLLIEQGNLCAYTMRRLHGTEECHIEHIEPQNSNPDKDLNYSNMAACLPDNGGDRSLGYGAPIKAGQAVKLNVDFVSPHSSGCDRRFEYTSSGEVHVTSGDQAASETTEKLMLNHPSLVELRRTAVQTHGLSVIRRSTRTSRKLLSASEARRLASEVLQADETGKLEPFCVALAQVALKYAAQEEARSQRLSKSHKS